MDGVKGADGNAGAKTQAAVTAVHWAAAGHPGRGEAVLDTHVVILQVAASTAGALDLGDFLNAGIRFHAHDFADLLGNRGAAHGARVDGRFACDNGGGIAAAAGVTAAAAVRAGKNCNDGILALIHIYVELFSCERQNGAKDPAQRAQN
ncbi:hypothetical protein SDC9_70357 [bioreactor metagenome]|uniref:Uncharacterized protein n=1 Tax=bioreactor metagenome TaxID=1076179 RepID=A0A644Y604_9ZZZZ